MLVQMCRKGKVMAIIVQFEVDVFFKQKWYIKCIHLFTS